MTYDEPADLLQLESLRPGDAYVANGSNFFRVVLGVDERGVLTILLCGRSHGDPHDGVYRVSSSHSYVRCLMLWRHGG